MVIVRLSRVYKLLFVVVAKECTLLSLFALGWQASQVFPLNNRNDRTTVIVERDRKRYRLIHLLCFTKVFFNLQTPTGQVSGFLRVLESWNCFGISFSLFKGLEILCCDERFWKSFGFL